MKSGAGAVGVVTAMETERRWFEKDDAGLLFEVAGIGRERAKAAAERLCQRGAAGLVSWGAAGGLDPALRPGAVILADSILEADGSSWSVNASWRERLKSRLGARIPVTVAPMFHTDEVIATPARKAEVRERWGAVAVDMESAGIAEVASAARVPWIVVRVVVDGAHVGLPKAALTVCDEDGRVRLGQVLRLTLQPRLWGVLLHLARANAAAGRSMRRLWALSRPDLAWPGG